MARTRQLRSNSTPPPPPHRQASVFCDPPRKNVLLLSCMDQRLLDDTVKFMNSLNLQNRYDQIALAGGAMGALKLPDHNLPNEERWRAVFFLHLEKAINALHRPIKDVFLLEHLDCGAYKYLHPEDHVKDAYLCADRDGMVELHRHELNEFAFDVMRFIDYQRVSAENELNEARQLWEKCKGGDKGSDESTSWEKVKTAAEKKAEAWSDIRISYFIMDLFGKVSQLDVPSGEPSVLVQ